MFQRLLNYLLALLFYKVHITMLNVFVLSVGLTLNGQKPTRACVVLLF